ncbi:Wall-associated receptor kinase-like 20 [Rhynchospora pubera]|uniref:Wall-associated receptor kinase-like 20 n=1 Tax=Rhynchospora pubera TaxID=906938 RepID=A0AAV8DHV2_9POAL|nr:Wall-associated receptor kinase-like 20 [Rhynchospora pubera]
MATPLLFVTLIFFGSSLPFASSSNLQQSCPPCGGLNIPLPLSTDSNCGEQNYRLYCNNNTLQFLSESGLYYQVISIDPMANRLVISVPTIRKNACISSDLKVEGLTLDDSLPFNISKRNEVMLFNCADDILLSPLNCTTTSPCRKFEATSAGKSCRNTLCCSYLKDSAMTSHRIRIRVGGCTAYTSVINMSPNDPPSTWKFGIELQWA